MPSGAAQELWRTTRSGWLPWMALALLWFAAVPWHPLLDPDEGRYAEIPREMLAQADFVTPRLDGLPYFEKPPLQYWATAAAYALFGFSEWTARLWTVGLGFLCLPLTFVFTRRLYGADAAATAALALAASPYFALLAHLNLLDAGFSFWLALTVFAFALAQSAPERSAAEKRWMLVVWSAAALAVLTKGIVVGVLAGGSLVLYGLAERDTRPWRRLHLVPGLALLLLIVVPWFVLVSRRNPSFPQFFFVHEHFARFLTTVHQRVEPWYYFVPLLLLAALPWLRWLPGGVAAAYLESNPNRSFKSLKFCVIFCAVTFCFFSLSDSKLGSYILPIMPPLAVAIGVHACRHPGFMRFTAQSVAMLLLVLAIGLWFYAMHRYAQVSVATAAWLVGAVVTAAIGSVSVGFRRRAATRQWWAAMALAILGWQCLLSAFAELPSRSASALVATVRHEIHPQTELFSVGQYRETISPYLGRTLTLVDFEGELAFGLSLNSSAALSDAEFLARWNAAHDAVAFLSPRLLESWRQRGLAGRVIGADRDTVVLSRT
jgi:4-amino-4-deoxy-L-arabinose transferase-like glycosyltransferase